MDTHKEFTVKQQIVFYVVSTLLVAVCVYFDFKNDNITKHTQAHTQTISIDHVKNNLSSYEVAHSVNSGHKV